MQGKHVIIGISGGIAAYKSAILIRLFKKAGAEVKAVATNNALEFVTKVTIETLSQNKLYCDLFAGDNDYTTEHVSLADWGDIFVVAPATANIIGKLANGIADDALSTTLLAFKGKVIMAPAMNVKMYEHFAVQKNIKYLCENGVEIINPAEGYLACGYEGKGRMVEPEGIFSFIREYLSQTSELAGKNALVTAGPTYEAIDAVRYIGNYSTGRMGCAIAEALAEKGAKVTLVCGPNTIKEDYSARRIDVVNAEEMYNVCLKEFKNADITVMAAAVADYTPENPSDKKLKKTGKPLEIKLKPTKDIILELGKKKRKDQILVGFALETNDEIANAKLKMSSKNMDFIVLNSLKDEGAGFGHSTNKVTIIDKKGITNFELKGKTEAAKDIVEKITGYFNKI